MQRALLGIGILLGFALLLGTLGTIPQSPYALLPGPRIAPKKAIPAFAHRALGHGIRDPEFRRWRQDHRLKSEWQFNHNLHRLLEGKLEDAPEEWLSLINGRRRIPQGSKGVHPNLAHPDFQTFVAEQVREYFQENPEKPALSIALADSYAFDQSARTQEIVEPLTYFRRRPDYSDLVFQFSNAVAINVFGPAGRVAGEEGEHLEASAGALKKFPSHPRVHMPRVPPTIEQSRISIRSRPSPSSSTTSGSRQPTQNTENMNLDLSETIPPLATAQRNGAGPATAQSNGAGSPSRRSATKASHRLTVSPSYRQPDSERWLTQLAYYWAEDVPSFKVHPQIIPTLTSDRLQWWDEKYKKHDQELIKAWSNAGPAFLGAWDYYEGNGFFIPRHAPSLIAESIQYLHAHNTQAFFAEGPPIWGFDAPKFWLAAQLLWEVNQDPEELLENFFSSMYGPAAGSMKKFFEACEQTWLNQEGEWQWLKYFRHPSQAELFPPERCAELMQILDQAWAEAKGRPLIRKRIALTRDAFRFTQVASEYYFAWKDLAQNPLATEEDFKTFDLHLASFHQKRQALEQIPDIRPPGRPWSPKERLLALNPEERLEYRRTVGQSDRETVGRSGSHTVSLSDRQTVSRSNRKFSFEKRIFPGDLRGLDAWTLRWAELDNGLSISAEPYENYQLRRIPGAGRDGSGAIQIQNANYTSLYTWEKVEPGKTYAASSWVRGNVQPGASTRVSITYYDAEQNFLDVGQLDETAAGTYADWIPLVAIEAAPENATWAFAALKIYRQLPGDWILIDSLAFQELE